MYLVNKIVGGCLNPLVIGMGLVLLGGIFVGLKQRRLGLGIWAGALVWLWLWSTPLMYQWIGCALENEWPVVKAENAPTAPNLDIGFKVFKLDTSNIIPWNPNPEDLKASLLAVVDNAIEGRTEDDLLYEILLKCNLPISLPVKKEKFGENTICVVGEGALMICLDKTITAKVAEEMVRLRDEVYKPQVPMQVVFRDNGFNDKEKANARVTLTQAGVEEQAILSI